MHAREQCVTRKYTDGRLDQSLMIKRGWRGSPQSPLPFYLGDRIAPDFPNFDHVAPIQTQDMSLSFELFTMLIRNKSVFLFCGCGCFLKRGSEVEERQYGAKRAASERDQPRRE